HRSAQRRRGLVCFKGIGVAVERRPKWSRIREVTECQFARVGHFIAAVNFRAKHDHFDFHPTVAIDADAWRQTRRTAVILLEEPNRLRMGHGRHEQRSSVEAEATKRKKARTGSEHHLGLSAADEVSLLSSVSTISKRSAGSTVSCFIRNSEPPLKL